MKKVSSVALLSCVLFLVQWNLYAQYVPPSDTYTVKELQTVDSTSVYSNINNDQSIIDILQSQGWIYVGMTGNEEDGYTYNFIKKALVDVVHVRTPEDKAGISLKDAGDLNDKAKDIFPLDGPPFQVAGGVDDLFTTGPLTELSTDTPPKVLAVDARVVDSKAKFDLSAWSKVNYEAAMLAVAQGKAKFDLLVPDAAKITDGYNSAYMPAFSGASSNVSLFAAAVSASADTSRATEEKRDKVTADNKTSAGANVATVQKRTDGANNAQGGDPVRLGTGEFVFSEQDVRIAAAGLEFLIERTYGSFTSSSGSFGKGWSSNLDTRIIVGRKPGAQLEWSSAVDAERGIREEYQKAMASYDSAIEVAGELRQLWSSMKAELTQALSNAAESVQLALSAKEKAAEAKTNASEANRLIAEAIDAANAASAMAATLAVTVAQAGGALAEAKQKADEAAPIASNALQAAAFALSNANNTSNSTLQQSAQTLYDSVLALNRQILDVQQVHSQHSGTLDQLMVSLPAQKGEADIASQQAVAEQSELAGLPANADAAFQNAAEAEAKARSATAAIALLLDELARQADIIASRDAELTVANNLLRQIDAEVQRATEEAERSARERSYDEVYAERNGFVTDRNSDAAAELIGMGKVLFVDEQGTPHVYTLEQEPVYESTSVLADGLTNYYPQGSAMVAEDPHATMTLELLADGSYLVRQKDGRSYRYGLDGLLRRIEDLNGNYMAFRYDEDRRLEGIEDTFGRRLSVQMLNGKVSVIVDPAGRTTRYGYDSLGRLVSVTDAEGQMVCYEYDGNLLTAIVKPDGSRRSYRYRELAGSMVVEATVDEEGNTERFRYYPELGYTEYENPSGIVEQSFYDEKYLTRRVRYADGTSVTSEYDERLNLVQRTDQQGRSVAFRYDDRGNMLEAVDAEGGRESWTYNEWSRVTSHTDARGSRATFLYDGRGNMTEVAYPDGSRVSYRYDAHGLVQSMTDQDGGLWEYRYDENGYVASVKDPAGAATTMVADATGNVLSVVDPLANRRAYEYNQDGRVVRVIDAEGSKEEYEYNNRKDLVRVTDVLGNITRFSYDRRHLLLKVENPLGERVEYRYREDGRLVEKLIQGTNRTVYGYDGRGNLIDSTQVETGVSTRYRYDSLGRVTGLIDARGNLQAIEYDGNGRVKLETRADGGTKEYSRDKNGNVTGIVDEGGNRQEYLYDPLNRLVAATDPYGDHEEFLYNGKGNLTRYTDKAGSTTSYQYDEVGRVVQITDALGNREGFSYDAAGRKIGWQDKNGNSWGYQYDRLGRPTIVVDPLGGLIGWSYDAAGNVTLRKDQEGNETRYEYDALSRLSMVTDPYGNKTRYSYTYLGQVASLTDALGNVQRYEYDSLGRMLGAVDALGNARSYGYDGNGNLTTATDELGRSTSYGYDALNRLVKETNPLGESRGYRYDALGNLLAEIDAKGSEYRYEYDKLSRLISETNRQGQTQRYSYDMLGNLVEKKDFGGSASLYDYDALGQLLAVNFADGTRNLFSYDAAGRMRSALNATRALEMSYDALGRLAVYWDKTLGQRVLYAYDATGNRTALSWGDNRRIAYRYGKAGELLSVQDTEGNETRFSYDELLREVRRELPNGVVSEKGYDAAGRLTMIRSAEDGSWERAKRLSSEAYLYDAAGQRTYTIDEAGQVTAYRYDAAGRIEQVSYPLTEGKEIADFQERLRLGLFPHYEGGKGKGSEGKSKVEVSLPVQAGAERAELKQALADTLNDAWWLYAGTTTVKPRQGGTWQVAAGGDGTEFAARLNPDLQTAQALEAALQSIAPGTRDFDANQLMWTERYGYDANDNRTSKANGWGKIEYTYDGEDRLSGAGARKYTVDANGNLVGEALGGSAVRYRYSAENRLTEAAGMLQELDSTVSYGYDGLGRRVSRTEYGQTTKGKNEKTWAAEAEWEYLYDGVTMEALAEFVSLDGEGKPRGSRRRNWFLCLTSISRRANTSGSMGLW